MKRGVENNCEQDRFLSDTEKVSCRRHESHVTVGFSYRSITLLQGSPPSNIEVEILAIIIIWEFYKIRDLSHSHFSLFGVFNLISIYF